MEEVESPVGNGAAARAFDGKHSGWRQFAEAATQEAFCSSWLSLQCSQIGGVGGAVVLLGSPDEGRPFTPVAFWPDRQRDLKHLAEVAERALHERRGLIVKRSSPNGNGKGSRYDVAYPIQANHKPYAVVALDIDSRPERELNDIMHQLQWGSAWLELLYHRNVGVRDAAPNERLQALVDVIATVVGQEHFRGTAVAFVTALATKLSCDRVSLGFLRNGAIEIVALSHSAQFGEDTNLIRAIAVAMEEAIDQESTVVLPLTAERQIQVTRAHMELARQYGNGAICSVPINSHDEYSGAVTFERTADQPFDRAAVELCEAVVGIAGPILQIQQRDDRPLWRKVSDAGRTQLEHLIGPHHMVLKLSVFGTLCLMLFLALVNGDYRVTAKTVIEPAIRRALAAPVNGYIGEARLRAGDQIQQGQLLAKLDDRELRLEQSKWHSQEEQSLKQYYEALGNRNAAQVQILSAQVDQAKAQVAMIEDQLARVQVTAPFDGWIVSGDWSQSLGAPIERGQVLFEVAPLEAFRVILQVDERDIGELALGKSGQIILSGFPTEQLPFTVKKITPVSTAAEGRNFFRVEAQLEGKTRPLQPGMEGVGKIEIDRRRLIWIWTHEVTDWLRLKLWYWLP
ncbi:MAG TPA: HlyD family efflux transporter periplasmic adaptor subunit [Candidatus Limnocylindrales bacterium]|nr:HlyD family efflux transporter periplasmic adaptor subunit [Candidatus Limnocylindrales bacterium]